MQLATSTSFRPCSSDRFGAQVEELHRLARAVEARSPGARAGLQQWLDGVQQSDDPRHVGLYVFGAALAQRLEGRTAAEANLYLRRYERAQIELFGREIADILGQPEGRRSERHESASQWLRRLADAGFDVAVDEAAAAAGAAQGPVQLRRRTYHCSLEAGGEPVVALFCARPQRAVH